MYVRNSSIKQDTPEGTIKNQEERLRQYVALRNMSCQFGEVVQVYVDRSLSAKNMNRPAVQKLLQDIESEKINMVMVSELSRITRSMKDFGEVWEFLGEKKCAFLGLRENVDTSNAAGEMVMYMLANIAQFERKQIGERVAANLRIRAKRGLYNGGPIPLGYKRNTERPGFLEIDEKEAETVRAAFDYFLKYETLSRTAKELNKDGVTLSKHKKGGGNFRLGFFTVDVLHRILRRKAYIGLRDYIDGSKKIDVKAVWRPIVDARKFARVQEMLSENRHSKKPFSCKKTFPYILTGIVSCQTCGDPMCGGSAHGKYKKYAYYIHGWASKKCSTMIRPAFKCNPHRVSASKLEEAVFKNIRSLVENPGFVKEMMEKVKRVHQQNGTNKEMKRLKLKVSSCNASLEALAERLGELPSAVSAKPIYGQMEKLEKAKAEALERLQELESNSGPAQELPADFEDYQKFLNFMGKALSAQTAPEIKAKILKRLLYKVEITPQGAILRYYVGKNKIGRVEKSTSPHFFDSECSDTLTNGRCRETRTPNLLIWNQSLYHWSYAPSAKTKERGRARSVALIQQSRRRYPHQWFGRLRGRRT